MVYDTIESNKIKEIDENLNEIIDNSAKNIDISNLLKIEKVFDINNLLNTLNNSLNKSANQNKLIEQQLEAIDKKREDINKTFHNKNEKCKEYMRTFYIDYKKYNELFNLYSNTVNDILKKNIEYNTNIDNILNNYIHEYTEYKNKSHNKSYPTNFLIQLVSNIILINDNKYKMNILFKNALKEEITTQLREIEDIENINKRLHANLNILNECDEIYNIIKDIEKNNNINIKEEMIKQLGNNI